MTRNGWLLGGAVLSCLLVPVLIWLRLQLSDRILPGVRVDGVLVPVGERAAAQALEAQADAWRASSIEVTAQGVPGVVRVSRDRLGATRSSAPILSVLRALGKTGNPWHDLHTWWLARNGHVDLRWRPTLDMERLSSFVESEQVRVEEPPVAGVTDGRGHTLEGQDGVALDHAASLAALVRALNAGQTQVALRLVAVQAPPPIEMGSPDGDLFEHEQEPSTPAPAFVPPGSSAVGPVRLPVAWLPARGDDCYETAKQRPFCDGPRMVPAPEGAAAELARQLRLGQLETVGALITRGPRPEWLAAVRALDAAQAAWPLPLGKLGRGFGFVRKAELRERIHAGIDIVAPRGSPIVASRAGLVAYSDNRVRGYGNLLVLLHADGSVTLSAHCQRIFVFAGERVARGQVIAEVGTTGLSMGPHLHFEYRVAGAPVDPLPLFAAASASSAKGR